MAQAEHKTDAARFSLAGRQARGAFVRPPTKFHRRVSQEKDADFPAESGRYHLFVSYACPWAHRTLVVRALKGLQDAISFSSVTPHLRNLGHPDYVGWEFDEDWPNPLYPEMKNMWQLYQKSVPDYPKKYLSVPVLWDKKTHQIVNNESAEIIEMLNSEFNAFAKNPELELNPDALQEQMDEVNELVYPNINDGVYRCGFAKTQQAYEEAFDAMFNAMDSVEAILSKQRYLCGDQLTLSDIRAFTTLLRFDSVYYVHFKCNKKQVRDYPNMWGFVREIFQMPGVAETVDMEYTKFHYYFSHKGVNARQIVAKGPEIDFTTPHGRDKTY